MSAGRARRETEQENTRLRGEILTLKTTIRLGVAAIGPLADRPWLTSSDRARVDTFLDAAKPAQEDQSS